jgi:hypothetical protein
MPDWLPAVIVGSALIVFAAALAAFQWRAWKAGPKLLPHDDEARIHSARQLRRRLQVSGFLAAIGVMIPLGDVLPIFRKDPLLFVIYWFAVLGLVVWMVLLVLGDLASNLAFNRTAQSQLEIERRTLEYEIRKYRAGANGHNGDDASSHCG